MIKKTLILLTFILPVQIFAFSLVGSPVKVPGEKEYIIYNKKLENTNLPISEKANIDTSLLVYNIQTQASKARQMFYIKDNEVNIFKDSAWAIPVSKMLTVATFEYLLDENIVSSLAFQDMSIRQDFTLSGNTPYGPIIDFDSKKFYFYISFYLKNEKTNVTKIKTFKYQQPITTKEITAKSYAKLTNKSLSHIFAELKPWLIKNLKEQKALAKNFSTPGPLNNFKAKPNR